ncbi:MAG: peptidoglycan-binding protein [Candidatus Omnitrophica bacterium]|nr:peptidoglycan-binding protein [Candidatus Omnitrophota bacterium]
MNKWILCLGVLFISGCVTADKYAELETTSQQKNQQVEALKNENASLKDQIVQLNQILSQSRQEKVRMPTAGEIQTALIKAGFYKGPVDNQIGSKTKDALRKFQQANGIAPDGVCGSRTWEKLIKYLDKKP